MNHQLLVAEFLATPWALMPERLNALAGVVMRWSAGIPAESESMIRIQADRVIRDSRRQAAAVQSSGGIAVLPLYGVVTQRGNMVDDVSGPGSTSTQQFSVALRQLLIDDTVGQILIDIDSPGGSVYGVAELADEIQSARSQKPIVAVANSLAASAAYWIGCSANEFYVTPGGEVGSIGVWQAHQDYSRALDEEGVKTTLISEASSRLKAIPTARWMQRPSPSCNPEWTITTLLSPRPWPVAGGCRSPRSANVWARDAFSGPMRRWHRTWSMASPPWTMSSKKCDAMPGN